MERSEIVERLNELLAAERSGVSVANQLAEALGEQHGLYEELKMLARNEAWCCAGLFEVVLRLGGTPNRERNDFADKVMRLESLDDRLALLNRGQGWVAKRLQELQAAQEVDPRSAIFLREMRVLHLENIRKFELLAACG